MALAFIRVLPIRVYTFFLGEVLEKMWFLTSQFLVPRARISATNFTN
jgi:hypothetical protein